MKNKISWAQICVSYVIAILLIIIAAVVTVSTEITFTILGIAFANASLGSAIWHSMNTSRMISRTNKKIDGLDKKLDGLLGKSKKK